MVEADRDSFSLFAGDDARAGLFQRLGAFSPTPGLEFGFDLGGLPSLGSYSVHFIGQTAHLDVQSVGAVVEPVSPIEAPGQQPSDPARQTLRVNGFTVTATGFRVRFNQPIDPVRLLRLMASAQGSQGQVVLLRDGQPIAGVLQIDADQRGFAFVVGAAGLLPGAYSVLLADGALVSAGGQALDGNGDGQAGGEFRVRFKVQARGTPLAAAESGEPTAALPVEGWLPALGGPGAVVTGLAGGFGGALQLRPGSRRRAGRAEVDKSTGAHDRRGFSGPAQAVENSAVGAPGAAIRLREEVGAPADLQAPLAGKPSWLGGWLGLKSKASNDWRIKL